MLAPVRLGQILVDSRNLEVVAVWAEGGGGPIALGPTASVSEAGEWALDEGAIGVVVRRRGDPQAFWWGPNAQIPFNKMEALPVSRMKPAPSAQRDSDVLERARRSSAYAAFWGDRAWSSLHPEIDARTRPLLPGDLADGERPAVAPDAEVQVGRHDMFGEGHPFLRGVIRTWSVAGIEGSRSDSEDSINAFFHAGPPIQAPTGRMAGDGAVPPAAGQGSS